jgi:hypothetical protein
MKKHLSSLPEKQIRAVYTQKTILTALASEIHALVEAEDFETTQALLPKELVYILPQSLNEKIELSKS